MTDLKFSYDHILVDVEGIYLDGVMINSYAVGQGVTVNHGDEANTTITLTIHAGKITVSDRVKAYAAENSGNMTETHGEQEVICERTYTAAKCVHTSRDGKLAEGSCDD